MMAWTSGHGLTAYRRKRNAPARSNLTQPERSLNLDPELTATPGIQLNEWIALRLGRLPLSFADDAKATLQYCVLIHFVCRDGLLALVCVHPYRSGFQALIRPE
jgi:hypothetical protein